MITCMTCINAANRWPTWEVDPRRALEREIEWECRWRSGKHGRRLKNELQAIETLIAEHRDEFDDLLVTRRQREEWLERKKRQGTS